MHLCMQIICKIFIRFLYFLHLLYNQNESSPSQATWPIGRRRSLTLCKIHQPKLQDHGHGASVSHGVPVYAPAYAVTKLHCMVTEANVCEL